MKRCKFRCLLLLLLVITVSCPSALPQVTWKSPIKLGANATPEEIASAKAFNRAIQLAAGSADRDSTVRYLTEALSCRPNDPDNLRIEYKIAVLLSQGSNHENPQGPKRLEALQAYEDILRKYNHMAYYQKQSADSIEDPQMMLPRAAIHAACLRRGLYEDSVKARECATDAMNYLRETYDTRRADILSEPFPDPAPHDEMAGVPRLTGSLANIIPEALVETWKKRRRDAREGNIFSTLENAIVQSAVRQYAFSFGPPRGLDDVVIPMSNIIRDYPGTPMAKIAQGYIERAKEKAFRDLDNEILDETIANIDTLSSESCPPGPARVFLPKASDASLQGRPFVLDLASQRLLPDIPSDDNVDSQQIHDYVTDTAQGDIAWDGVLLTLREAKASAVSSDTNQQLEHVSGQWVHAYNVPEGAKLPYAIQVTTKEGLCYLVTIDKIDSKGVWVHYGRLTGHQSNRLGLKDD